MDSAQDSYKKWGIALIVFLLILIPTEIALTRPKAIDNLKAKLGLVSEENSRITTLENKTNLILSKSDENERFYFIDLVYDPTTNKLTEEKSGQAAGHLPAMAPKSSESSETLNLKLEVLSENEVIISGWLIKYKDFITKSDGKYHFQASFPYISQAKINIYSISGEKLLEDSIR